MKSKRTGKELKRKSVKDTASDGTERLKKHRWAKGQSGNPNGRPKKLPKLEKILAHLLGEMDENGESELKNILQNMINEAKKTSNFSKNTQAARMIMEYAYGQPQKVEDEKDTQPIVWQEEKTYEEKKKK
jgi:hypothetical protein